MEQARVQLGHDAGVTQEVAPRVSVEVNYIRRTWGTCKTTINRALTPADFDTFIYNVPQDPSCRAAADTR